MMYKHSCRNIAAFLAAITVGLTALPVCGAQPQPEDGSAVAAPSVSAADADYAGYLAAYSDIAAAKESVRIAAAEGYQPTGADVAVQSADDGEALLWRDGGSILWNITAQTEGLYNLKLTYAPTETGVDFTFGVMLDGAYPFSGAEAIEFPRLWVNADDGRRTDRRGNELSPEQREIDGFITAAASDSTGVAVEYYRFYLSAGAHTVALTSPGQPVLLSAIELVPAETTDPYQQVYDSGRKGQNADADVICIEGEDAAVKTSSALIPRSDNGNAGMSPSDPFLQRLNYIGGTTWQEPGETLVWNFTVEKAGYYALGVRYRQSDVVNAESWRRLRIDGETPFSEAAAIRFPYTPNWKFYTFSEDDEPYYIWLEAGTHTLSLEVTLGAMAEYYSRLSAIVEQLSNEYISIVKITGATPDISLDYELFNQIPDLNTVLESCEKELTELSADLQSFTGKRGSQYIASINNMVRVIRKMIKNPYVAHHYVSDYYTNYTSLSSWLYDMKSMPLSIDMIQLAPAGVSFEKTGAGIFRRIGFMLQRLAASFTEDYTLSEASQSDSEGLRLWVNWGRDQASVLDALIRDSFTEQTGIEVRLEITNASLVNGILSGNFPDLALHMARTEPVNLGMRGALCDLTQFSDLDEVLKRFQTDAEIPYRLGDALYALPDTQNFYMMFYRSDILASLGLSVPATWDEYLYTAAIIQRNNMDVYVPYTQITTSTTVNAGIGSLNLFATLMGQNGLSLYNEVQNATALDTPDAIRVFGSWCRLYTDYGFQKEADFYNRFRIGVMPLGIAPYTQYMTLYSAAPEISGRWALACVPGTDSGNDSVAGAGTGCAIVEKSEHKDEAWEFLKWWTSSETQTRYSNNVESLLGMLGRTQTATVEALKALSWERDDLEIILAQWEKVQEVPEVPGSYYLSRALDQAYWSVLNDGTGFKDSIVKWSQVADHEIDRKIREYS